MEQIKKVSLIGLGGVGSMFAAHLSQILGENFRLVAAGERKKRLEGDFPINGQLYRFKIVEPGEQGDPADLVIVTVKGYSLDEAIRDIQNQVGPNTLILNFLNGVECEERLIAEFGKERVLYGYTYIVAVLKDGVASYVPSSVKVRFGDEINEEGAYSPRVKLVKELFERAQIPHEVERDIRRGMWKKFLMNIAENMPLGVLRITYAGYRSEHFIQISRAAKAEVIAIAQAKGIDLRPEDSAELEQVAAKRYGEISSWQPSTCNDLDAGKTTEIEIFSGSVVRMGQQLGIPTPCNEILYHGIKVMEQKNQGLFD